MKAMKIHPATLCKYGNMAAILFMAVFFFIAPVASILRDLADPALRGPGIPRCAWRWHRSLTPRYARWARARVASGIAGGLRSADVAGTEWPLFGSVFYLLATETLQAEWQRQPIGPAPKEYAREAIDAAAALVADPGHAGWVRKYWGDDYLHKENCFYRMLLISATASHVRLTGSDRYVPLLRDQVEALSREIDASPEGWIDDYPEECYPTDVLAAISAIKRADTALGADHSVFLRRALRGFSGDRLDPDTGLPPYLGERKRGRRLGPPRGCANSYMALFAPEVWPEKAKDWYARYERYFWQHRWLTWGFREWPRGWPGGEWYIDVDSGPVIAGHGTAASAFGLGAARVNGRFDHAWPLAAQALVTCWPLPNGMLAGPRILSDATDAPYLGEAGMLFSFTRQPLPGFAVRTGGNMAGSVYLFLAAYLVAGAAFPLAGWLSLRRWMRQADRRVPFEKIQVGAWLVLTVGGLLLLCLGGWRWGLVVLLLTQFLPCAGRQKGEPPIRT